MKKITTLLFCASLTIFSFTSCSDDDSTTEIIPQEVNDLIGKWRLNTMSVKSSENGQVIEEFNDLPVGAQMQWDYTFNSDNTVEYIMAIPAAGVSESGAGTYIKNGNTITITIEDEPQTFDITKLDADNFHVKFVEEYEDAGVSYKDEIEQKFIR